MRAAGTPASLLLADDVVPPLSPLWDGSQHLSVWDQYAWKYKDVHSQAWTWVPAPNEGVEASSGLQECEIHKWIDAASVIVKGNEWGSSTLLVNLLPNVHSDRELLFASSWNEIPSQCICSHPRGHSQSCWKWVIWGGLSSWVSCLSDNFLQCFRNVQLGGDPTWFKYTSGS